MMNLSTVTTISRMPLVKGKDLKTWREDHGLTQKELAELLKVATNTVSRWEIEARTIPEFLDLALETIERKLTADN